MRSLLHSLLHGVPSSIAAAMAATVALLLFLLWQNALDGAAPMGLSSLAWFESLTPLDRRLLTLGLLIPGGLLWLWAMRADTAPVDDGTTPALEGPAADRRRRRALAAGAALVLFPAVVAPLLGEGGAGLGIVGYGFRNRAANGFQWIGTLLWLAGIGLFVWSLAEPVGLVDRLRRLLAGQAVVVTLTATALAVILIAVLAGHLRLYDLDGLPYEMTSDHTEKLLDVREVIEGSRPVFLPLNGGREPLQFYWTAFLVALGLPFSFLTLKLGAALVSVATVPLAFGLGRAVGGRGVGLLAALTLALAPWHIQITRIALRTGWSPLFAAACLWLLVRALEHGRRNDWLMLGIATGLGMYGYSGLRPMAVLLVLAIAGKLWLDARRRGESFSLRTLVPPALARNLAVAAGAALATTAPLIRYALDRPEDFWGRTVSRVSGAEVALVRPPAEQLLVNWKNALLMFNATADAAWFHSPAGRPALETVGGALLVAGVLTALYRGRRGDWRAAMLLLAVPVMLLSSALALAFPVEVPHLTRASGALPAVVVLVALALPPLARLWRAALGAAGDLVYLALLAMLFVPMAANSWHRVFDEYRTGYLNATHPTREGAEVANSFLVLGGDLDHVYLVSWPHGWDYRALGLLVGDPDWRNVLEGTPPDMIGAVEAAEMHVADPAAKLYFVGGPRAHSDIEYLRVLYPAAVVTPHASRMPGKDFWSVYVPPESAATFVDREAPPALPDPSAASAPDAPAPSPGAAAEPGAPATTAP